jgi:phosphoglycolate phosphatase
MADKKLILWDIDGTLIVSGRAGIFALTKAFANLHGRTPDLGKIEVSGRTDQWIAGQVLEQQGLAASPENIHAYLEAYLQVLPEEIRAREGRVLPGIVTLLDILHGRADIAQGLLTGNLQRGARIKLGHYRVWHYFEFGAYGDDSPWRNELGPHALRRAQQKHAVEFAPANTFVIGDTPHDIECGKAIGAKTIGVATGRFTVTELLSHQPTAVFANFADPAAFLRVIDAA